MLIPMGLPKDVSVIAWGLSLERYDINNKTYNSYKYEQFMCMLIILIKVLSSSSLSIARMTC